MERNRPATVENIWASRGMDVAERGSEDSGGSIRFMQSGSSRPRPSCPRAILKARAEDRYADRDVIRKAVHEFHVDRHDWPEVRDRGQVPSGLEDYRPGGFDFQKPEYVLHFENWSTMGKAPLRVGLTVICNDEALGRAILERMGSNACPDGATKFSWILER